MTESAVAGSWRGENGIEMIRLQQGGTGFAFFSSGARMDLSYTIKDNTLTVRQNSPNTDGYYYPLPYGVAKQLTEKAGPMQWEFTLYSDGTLLRGVRIADKATVKNNQLVDLTPSARQNTEWTKR
jgi:hypothetical protein